MQQNGVLSKDLLCYHIGTAFIAPIKSLRDVLSQYVTIDNL